MLGSADRPRVSVPDAPVIGMSPAPALQTPALPSLRHLALASSCALLGAGAIFLAAILPAEFGVDPLVEPVETEDES